MRWQTASPAGILQKHDGHLYQKCISIALAIWQLKLHIFEQHQIKRKKSLNYSQAPFPLPEG